MPVFTHSAYGGKGRSGGGSGNALDIGIQLLGIKEDYFAAQNDGKTVNDPLQLDQLIEGYNKLLPMATDAKDSLKLQGKVAVLEAQKQSLERTQTGANISSALTTDLTENRFKVVNAYASSPIGYLTALSRSFMGVQSLGQSMVEQLNSQGRTQEADTLSKQLQKPTDEVNIFNDLAQHYDDNGNPLPESADFLKNYAVVYKTNHDGQVIDLQVKASNDAENTGGAVELLDKSNNSVTMNGLRVFLNRQNDGATEVVRLGNKKATVGKGAAGISETGLQQNTPVIAQLNEDVTKDAASTKLFGHVASASPATAIPGTYATYSNGRVFRFNNQFKWDEIAPNAVSLMPDFNKDNAIKVDSLSTDHIKGNSGKVITKDDLVPMSSVTGQPLLRSENPGLVPGGSGGGQSSGPAAPAPMSSAKTNRQTGFVRPGGPEAAQQTAQKMFSGQYGA